MSTLQQDLIATAQAMAAAGLNKGTAGNLSVRSGEGFFITPTGMDYANLKTDDIPWVGLDGTTDGTTKGTKKPSSEWRFHRDIYHSRPEAGAILHAHSPFAVSLAVLRRDIPPFHYMIARFGGDTIRCSTYALFGSQELSEAALVALKDRCACLLANHGLLVYGSNLKQTLDLGIELEALCEQYWRALQIGKPIILTPEEMAAVQERFASYGQQHLSPSQN